MPGRQQEIQVSNENQLIVISEVETPKGAMSLSLLSIEIIIKGKLTNNDGQTGILYLKIKSIFMMGLWYEIGL